MVFTPLQRLHPSPSSLVDSRRLAELAETAECAGGRPSPIAHFPHQFLHMPSQKLTRRDRKAADTGVPKATGPKLTKEEQEELEEKELEEKCEKWCGYGIRLITLGSLFWGMLTSVSEWAFRPPVILEPVSLDGQTFVLTGGTEGIGASAARSIALSGGRLVLGVRNLTKGEDFAAALRRDTGHAQIEARYLDLAKLDSVVAFASGLREEEDGISALLNNAASAEASCGTTDDGFELATQVNYLAPALLTNLLLPSLESASGGDGRAVHVSCPAMSSAKLDTSHLEMMPVMLGDEFQCDGFGRYAAAKLMLTAYSSSLSSKRTAGQKAVTSNVYDPGGTINTPGADQYKAKAAPSRRMGFGPHVIIRKVLGYVLSPIFGPIGSFLGKQFIRKADEGGNGLVHLATSPHLKRVSGKYFSLAATGFTRASGCTERFADECGLAKSPANLPAIADAAALWDATHAALAPWLDGAGVCKEGDGECAAAAKQEQQMSEWDEE